jgi:FkbM family methyltransferase
MNIDLSNVIIFTHDNNDYISRVLTTYGIWEPNVSYFMLGLAKGGIMLDVGANIGYYSLLTAHKYSHIYAFEPIHYNYSLLEKSIERNNLENISIIKKCAGDIDGASLDLIVLPFNYGASRNKEKTKRMPVLDADTFEVKSCEQITLDSFIAEHNITSIDMIKIDVEGYEKNVLDGFKSGLASRIATHICIEFSANMLPIKESVAILSTLKSAGYKLFDIGLQEVGTVICSVKYDDITNVDFLNFATHITQTNILASSN